MFKTVLSILLFAAVVLYGCEGDGKRAQKGLDKEVLTAIDAAADSLDKLLDGDLSPAEKLPLIMKFLERFPESRYTMDLVEDAVYYRGTVLGDTSGAVAFAENIRGRITDPGLAQEFDKDLISFYGDALMMRKMAALADSLDKAGALKFVDYFRIASSASEARAWRLARDFCARSKDLANAETFRADYPDHEYSDEYVEKAGNNRRGMLLVVDSWARANLGEIDEAIAGFTAAGQLVRRSYLNIPEYNLDIYWGRTLLMKGDFQGALDLLAPDALIRREEEASAAFREAYLGLHKTDTGYRQYAVDLQASIAKKIDGFELPDFDGKRRSYADLKGDVTLLVFWSPT